MKHNKHWLAAALAAVLFAGLFTGCGASSGATISPFTLIDRLNMK